MADDELAAAVAEKRAALITATQDASDATITDMLFRCGLAAGAGDAFMRAVEAVLEMHAQTAFARYAEPCARHLYVILPRRDCWNCVKVERAGCQRCRDENGHPAKPEDCAERNAVLGALTGKGNDGGGPH